MSWSCPRLLKLSGDRFGVVGEGNRNNPLMSMNRRTVCIYLLPKIVKERQQCTRNTHHAGRSGLWQRGERENPILHYVAGNKYDLVYNKALRQLWDGGQGKRWKRSRRAVSNVRGIRERHTRQRRPDLLSNARNRRRPSRPVHHYKQQSIN